jgi:hypothetical protein
MGEQLQQAVLAVNAAISPAKCKHVVYLVASGSPGISHLSPSMPPPWPRSRQEQRPDCTLSSFPHPSTHIPSQGPAALKCPHITHTLTCELTRTGLVPTPSCPADSLGTLPLFYGSYDGPTAFLSCGLWSGNAEQHHPSRHGWHQRCYAFTK